MEIYENKEISKHLYGDMGVFNYAICEMNYFKYLHHEYNTDLCGTIWNDAQNTTFTEDKLFIRSGDYTKGIISLVHYNGDKPWFAYKPQKWRDNVGLRQENNSSLDLWTYYYNDMVQKTKIEML
jgi:hypothetical protein